MKYTEYFCQSCSEVEHNPEKQYCGYCGKFMTQSTYDNDMQKELDELYTTIQMEVGSSTMDLINQVVKLELEAMSNK